MPSARRDLVPRHRLLAHEELRNHRGDHAGDDEAWLPSRLRREHHGRQRYAITRTEERGDPDEREEVRAVRCGAEQAADRTSQQRPLDDEWDEQSADAATTDGHDGR